MLCKVKVKKSKWLEGQLNINTKEGALAHNGFFYNIYARIMGRSGKDLI